MSVSARRAFPGLGQQWRWGPRLPQFRTTTRAKLLSRWSLPTLQQLFGRSARRTTLTEGEIIPCTAANVKLSHVGQDLDARLRLYEESIASPEKFWASIAKSDYHWEKLWEDDSKVLSYNFHRSKGPISVKWFEGGVTNMCYNCLDRHLPAHKDRVCFYSEGNETSHVQTLTYGNMYTEVVQIANILKNQYGIKKGDCVSIYLPMVPFAVAAMLACARIGAVTSVVFAGFSAQALAARMTDANAKLLITADASARGAKPIYLKQVVDEAYDDIETEVPCLVYENFQRQHCTLKDGRDTWYSDALARLSVEEREKCPIEWVDAEDPLFMLYTSGSTGAPKALLHTTAGYMVYAGTTFKYSFDYHPEDVYFCTADVGWITGHTYVAYGPMLHCATSVIHEGLPVYPTASRWWEMVDRYKVSIFYTAPTAIRALMQQGDEHVKTCSRASLRVLGTVGEPINVEAWRWYHDLVGNGHADVADTWWQTETGGHLITPLPGCTPQKPGSATLPFFGVVPVILDSQSSKPISGSASGLFAIEKPWPSIARSIYNNHERYEKTYFHVDGVYLTGDGARRDKDGYYWITGRVDDVLNVSGHRLGTSEIENAVNFHPAVVESAVVGVHHDVKGESIYVFVTFHKAVEVTPAVMNEVKESVREIIGPMATPDFIQSAQCGLPKTRSGKIVRRILRKIAAGTVEDLGDTSTLSDPAVVDSLLEEKRQWVSSTH